MLWTEDATERMDERMQIAIGAVLGLVWGALWGVVNMVIMKKAVARNETKAVLAANLGRMAIDVAALAAVFLLRGLLPFSWEAMLVTTALALSAVSIVFAFRYGKRS